MRSEKVTRGRPRRQAHVSSLAAKRIGMAVGCRSLGGTRNQGQNLIPDDSGVDEHST